MNWFIKCLRQYADFKGRAQRAEYWYFSLFYFLAYVVGFILDNALGTHSRHKGGTGLMTFLVFVALCVPAVAVGIRRLHDTGRSGWWTLINLLPFVGPFIFLYFTLKDSEPGDNRYGPNPKGVPAEAEPAPQAT